MKDRVQELSTHLELELKEEFAVFATKEKMVYTLDNMNLLEDTFQKVCCSLDAELLNDVKI